MNEAMNKKQVVCALILLDQSTRKGKENFTDVCLCLLMVTAAAVWQNRVTQVTDFVVNLMRLSRDKITTFSSRFKHKNL